MVKTFQIDVNERKSIQKEIYGLFKYLLFGMMSLTAD